MSKRVTVVEPCPSQMSYLNGWTVMKISLLNLVIVIGYRPIEPESTKHKALEPQLCSAVIPTRRERRYTETSTSCYGESEQQ